MKLLLSKEPHLSRIKTINGLTPLAYVCRYRFDDDAVRIAELLLDAGADIEQGADWTPLLFACRNGRADLVSFLLQRGANFQAVDGVGWNCFHVACLNGAFGKDIIPLLVKAGVDVAAKTNVGEDALAFALGTNYDMAETLLQHLPKGSDSAKLIVSVQDPIGNMMMLVQFGLSVKSFGYSIVDANVDWARLRNGEKQCFNRTTDEDIFNVLSQRNDPKLWILVSREPCFQQHPQTGDTVLHLLSRTNKLSFNQKMEVFAALKKDYRNPLIPNFQNERAIDLTSDPALKLELAKYMEWRPKRRVMHWYGPLFRERERLRCFWC